MWAKALARAKDSREPPCVCEEKLKRNIGKGTKEFGAIKPLV